MWVTGFLHIPAKTPSMGWRFFTALATALAGAALGAALHVGFPHTAITALESAALSALLAILLWVGVDCWRAAKLTAWLRAGDELAATTRYGIWGEIAHRVRRLLAAEQQKTKTTELRMDAFLASMQASPNGVVLLDASACMSWCNTTAAAHFNINPTRDVRRPISHLIADADFVRYFDAQDYAREVVLQPAATTRVAVQLHFYGTGQRLLLSRDVTAIEKADAMRRDFIANVSHEIRTPLTVLAGFVETMQSVPLDDAARTRSLDLMAAQAKRMQSLVADLLTLSRIEAAPPPSATDWQAVEPVLARCETEARELSALLGNTHSCRHDFRFDLTPGIEIAGNATELQSAFSNLISNAVRYTPTDGVITVTLRAESNGTARFRVADNGPGIAPEHVSRLTERFYRVDRSRSRETGGTGLGLAIVKHVVQRHGAELAIESVLGQGSQFSITFPAHRVRKV